ncbi:heavy-metal-associated domain-containing protein [Mycobacterium sp. 050134]|uniref:heavy-metal-associated domain-containing protein n=1 Tax=Mycobacterium sp. 050134 TaxID=3096111 RepID=UPI003FA59E04
MLPQMAGQEGTALTELGAAEARMAHGQRIELDVTGMSCGACARRVEKALNKIDGVRASVDFATRVATIESDCAPSVSDLCESVRSVGYGATQRSAGAEPSADLVTSPNPALLRSVLAHLAPLAGWLMSPLHR